tara:strand:+ start:5851 stop:6684 length:834 start_codon:yes stop_codon:yes gene_type:complete
MKIDKKENFENNKFLGELNDKIKKIAFNGTSEETDTSDFLDELQEQFIEMGQLKSDFDVEKFTVKKEGNFLAHNFHFLMRQYSLTLTELRRMILLREEMSRYVKKYQKLLEEGEEMVWVVVPGEGRDEKWVDIELARQWNEMKGMEVTMTNKIAMIRKFEECRQKLIEMNGGKPPTNKEYQEETPAYWKWYFERLALWQIKAHATGISRGTWENIDLMERQALIDPEFQLKVLNDDGMFDMKQIELNNEIEKQLGDGRVKKILKELGGKDIPELPGE